MAPKIIIFFPVGAFGSTLEYCIRRFSLEFDTIETQIQPDGSMHSLSKEAHLLYQNDFQKIQDSAEKIFTPVYPNLTNSTVRETIQHFKSFYNNQKVVFITLDNEQAVEKNEFFGFYKLPNKIAVQSKLENIRQWNPEYKTVFDMQRWELREYVSLMYEDLIPMMTEAHSLAQKEWLSLNPQALLDNFSGTVKKIINYCNLTLNDEPGLEEFAQVWVSKQQYIIEKHNIMNHVFENTVHNKSFSWDSLDIIGEAILQYKFKKQGMFLKCFNLDVFPTSTQALLKCFD